MSNAETLALGILGAAEALNERVKSEDLTVAQARRIVRSCREAEGWLKGVREVLDV